VTYTVEVKADGKRGNDRIGNFLLDPGQPAPASCTGADPDRLDCTVDHVSNVVVTKSSSPADGSKVGVGDDITYTLTFRNVSKDADAAPTKVDQVDHLGEVLDDAVWKSGPSVSDGSLAATRSGDELHVTGALPPGQVTTVTYAVTVTGKGDGRIRNVVVPAGEQPVCAAGSPNCTSQVSPVVVAGGDDAGGTLPDTGSAVTPRLVGLGLGCLLLGFVLVLTSRRRRA
jgi:LPXTG-motif cell wall-anchored protein